MMNSQEFDILSREIESLKQQLAAGIPVPAKGNRNTVIADDDPNIHDPPTTEFVPGSNGDMYMIYKGE